MSRKQARNHKVLSKRQTAMDPERQRANEFQCSVRAHVGPVCFRPRTGDTSKESRGKACAKAVKESVVEEQGKWVLQSLSRDQCPVPEVGAGLSPRPTALL